MLWILRLNVGGVSPRRLKGVSEAVDRVYRNHLSRSRAEVFEVEGCRAEKLPGACQLDRENCHVARLGFMKVTFSTYHTTATIVSRKWILSLKVVSLPLQEALMPLIMRFFRISLDIICGSGSYPALRALQAQRTLGVPSLAMNGTYNSTPRQSNAFPDISTSHPSREANPRSVEAGNCTHLPLYFLVA